MTSDGRIRILFCENNIDGTVGGSYYSLLYLVKGLDRARFEPIVLFYTEHSLLPAFREAGIETLVWTRAKPVTFGARLGDRLPPLRPPAMILQKAANMGRGFMLPALERASFIRKRGIDLVHLNNTILFNHDWMLAARLTRTPCVTHERGINERYPPLARFFGRGLDAVICISEAVRTNMRERGADFGNLVTILNGLDPNAMRFEVPPEQIRARYGIQPDAAVIVMLGNIKAWKGQETLVRAIARVRDAYPAVKCLLVGGTSPSERDYETTLRALVSSLGVQDEIVFTGFQQNVGDFIRASDVVAHASIEPEPFGRVILEAMACRKPVIGSRAGAIPEIIVEGETGVTFPPGDDAALARAIVSVIGDRARARQMGDKGFERLSREFHIRQNVESTVRLYDRLLSAAH